MEEDDDEPARLASVAEKAVQPRCKAETLSYCPSMDLIALATEDEQLHVFRLNGQRVFGGSYSSSNLQILRLRWKPNGHLIAVASSDNKLRLFSAYTGKSVHTLFRDTTSHSRLSCLGWGLNFVDGKATQKQLLDSHGEVSLDSLLTPSLQLSALQQLKTDLPRELALLDIETSLPKLSTLISTGDENDVFSSRASVDSIFHSTKVNGNESVDVLLAGFDDGSVRIRIFDCFDIGLIKIADSIAPSQRCAVLYHASHPLTSTHSIIVKCSGPQHRELRLVTLDFRFIQNSGRYLSLLASKSTQLQNLLRYINQVQEHILQEWKTSQDLPTKFMRNINEELSEKYDSDFVAAAYHLVVTGDCSEALKEFLVDQVGERGHKRWEKAIVTGYESIRCLTHECLLPALERCGVLLSRLQGLSKFQNSSQLLGIGTRQIADCLALVDCINLLGNQLLLQSGRELRQFVCFAKWLRQEIDIQGIDPASTSAEDSMERTDNIDYSQVLAYIQGGMTKSALQNYFRASPNEPTLSLSTGDGSGAELYSEYKQALKSGSKGTSTEQMKLNDLTLNLGSRFQNVFAQIAETQKRNVLVSSPLVLSEDCDSLVVDIKMCMDCASTSENSSVYIAARSRSSERRVYLYRVILETLNGVSSAKEFSTALLDFPSSNVKDFRFVDENDLMFLVWGEGLSYLVSLPFQASSGLDLTPLYTTCFADARVGDKSTPLTAQGIDLRDSSVRGQYVRHIFPQDAKRVPIKMEVNGRKGRRVVCVLYEDRLHYSVFDLDSNKMGDAEDEGSETVYHRADDEVEMIDVE